MLREEIEDSLESLPIKKFLILLVLLAVPLVLLPRFVVIAAFIVATYALAYSVGYLGLRWTGMELATFSTVLIGVTETPLVAGLIGLILVLGQMISGGWSGLYLLWVVPAYFFAGVAASVLGASNLVFTGLAITAGLHVVFAVFTSLFSRGRLMKYLVYAAMNIGFNALLFLMASSFAVSLLP